jgi:hypothetical protein
MKIKKRTHIIISWNTKCGTDSVSSGSVAYCVWWDRRTNGSLKLFRPIRKERNVLKGKDFNCTGNMQFTISCLQFLLSCPSTCSREFLEMVSFASERSVTANKRAVLCTSEFCWWNWMHYIRNSCFQIIFTARIILYISAICPFNMPHK